MVDIKRFGKNQKFRIICGDASFYTTANSIRNGLGSSSRFNAAAQKALDSLEFERSTVAVTTGIAGTWEGIQVQINKT